MSTTTPTAETKDESTTTPPPPPTTNKTGTSKQSQIQKLKDANNKYKQLLKLAKERIETQQTEIDELSAQLSSDVEKNPANRGKGEMEDGFQVVSSEDGNDSGEQDGVITRVCLCVKEEVEEESGTCMLSWALLKYETAPLSDDVVPLPNMYKQWNSWKSFHSEADLVDFVRRNAASGEPLSIPPFSLSPEESQSIKQESQQVVAHLTEEFRRYRVKSEVTRKQADNALKAAQVENVTQTQRRIETEHTKSSSASLGGTECSPIEVKHLKRELAEQELRWKEAYSLLEQENKLLKDGGPRAEATLAGQWRHRYEECLKEKDELEARIETLSPQKGGNDKLEAKYRSLREEYRLYRKKAKEIFEDQQRGNLENEFRAHMDNGSTSEDPRIAYLRSLMVSYLTAEIDVKDQMESAIYTVLKFSATDKEKVKESRDANASYFW